MSGNDDVDDNDELEDDKADNTLPGWKFSLENAIKLADIGEWSDVRRRRHVKVEENMALFRLFRQEFVDILIVADFVEIFFQKQYSHMR